MEDEIGSIILTRLVEKYGPVVWRQRYWALAWRAALKARGARQCYSSKFLIDYLQSTYSGTSFLSVSGNTYPVTVYSPPTPIMVREDNSSALTRFDEGWTPSCHSRAYEYYWYMRTAIPSHQNLTFVLKCLSPASNPSLECGWVRYFSVLQTADALEWELLAALAAQPRGHRNAQLFHSSLPLRRFLHERIPNPLIDGDGRADAIAVSCLLICETDDGPRLLLQRRGKWSQALRRGMVSAVPAGMFQSPFEQPSIECSPYHCFLWEFYEELFGKEDPGKKEKKTMPTWFYGDSPVIEIRNLLKNGEAVLYFTGIAVDLLNLRPDILLMLHIWDTSWFRRHSEAPPGQGGFKFNDEWNNYLMANVQGSEEDVFQDLNLDCSKITPPSAAALAQGLRCFMVPKSQTTPNNQLKATGDPLDGSPAP